MATKKAVPFGRYLLLDPIKDGGMSEIWRARPQGEASVVAIKRVLPAYAEDPEMQSLLLDEARVSVQLTHPNIARVFDLGRVGSEIFLAMEYVPGVDLRSIFKREAAVGRNMPVPLAVLVLAQVCDALDYAHRRVGSRGEPLRIVHRDVAPDNVLVTFDGEVKLIDFGVAKAAGQSNKTEAGALKGKLSYMSPEQVLGQDLDRRSDVFSVGTLLWEMVTGERLFWRENQLEILRSVRIAKVAPPSQLNREVSRALERAILRALSREREARFAWASELGAALRACLEREKSPPTAVDLCKYLALSFPEELQAERRRRMEWARFELETAAPTKTDLKAVTRPMPKRRPAPPVEAPEPAAGVAAVDDGAACDQPTVVQALVRTGPGLRAGAELPVELLDPSVPLPPPIPSPRRPTAALQAFARETAERECARTDSLKAFDPAGPEDEEGPTAPVRTAPPASQPKKPTKR